MRYFGIPVRIVCDNERGLMAKDIVEEINKLTKLEIHRTIAYVSGGKSLVERSNRTVNHALKRLTDGDQSRNWPAALPAIMNTINNIRSATTGFSPSQIALGRATTLLDYDDSRHRNGNLDRSMPWMDYMNTIRRMIYPLVCNRIEAAQNKRAEKQDKVKPIEYKKYDLVYVSRKEALNPMTKGKIQTANFGPCIVLKKERYDNTEDVHRYTIKYLINGTIYQGVHYRRLLK
eukprot:Nk52_evm1s911 gene=Nk52_evmTU1s911